MGRTEPNNGQLATPREGRGGTPAIVQTRGEFWAITSYFNPLQYQHRLINYRIFRDRLQIPLITVELGYGPNFELQPGDAEILVQLRGGSVMWQKERLLNIALGSLPIECAKVAWLDCDIIFDAPDWPEIVSSLLDRFMLVQPFTYLYRTPKEWRPTYEQSSKSEVRSSSPFLMASGMPKEICLGRWSEEIKSAPGCAWATHRELLERHQLYDSCVVGGGDSAILRAAYGYFDEAIRFQHMNEERREHYCVWASKFYDAVHGSVTFAPGNLFHLWHGAQGNRRYRERFQEFSQFEFDPIKDITVDGGGVLALEFRQT